jgi:hypothetical protein
MEELGEKETFLWNLFWTLKRNETPEDGPT